MCSRGVYEFELVLGKLYKKLVVGEIVEKRLGVHSGGSRRGAGRGCSCAKNTAGIIISCFCRKYGDLCCLRGAVYPCDVGSVRRVKVHVEDLISGDLREVIGLQRSVTGTTRTWLKYRDLGRISQVYVPNAVETDLLPIRRIGTEALEKGTTKAEDFDTSIRGEYSIA